MYPIIMQNPASSDVKINNFFRFSSFCSLAVYDKDLVHSDFTDSNKDKFISYLPIQSLTTKKLKKPIDITIKNDEDGFISYTTDFPFYGHGDTYSECIDSIKWHIENTYEELKEDDKFSPDWLDIKSKLIKLVME